VDEADGHLCDNTELTAPARTDVERKADVKGRRAWAEEHHFALQTDQSRR
jgi:hypothetical protein